MTNTYQGVPFAQCFGIGSFASSPSLVPKSPNGLLLGKRPYYSEERGANRITKSHNLPGHLVERVKAGMRMRRAKLEGRACSPRGGPRNKSLLTAAPECR